MPVGSAVWFGFRLNDDDSVGSLAAGWCSRTCGGAAYGRCYVARLPAGTGAGCGLPAVPDSGGIVQNTSAATQASRPNPAVGKPVYSIHSRRAGLMLTCRLICRRGASVKPGSAVDAPACPVCVAVPVQCQDFVDGCLRQLKAVIAVVDEAEAAALPVGEFLQSQGKTAVVALRDADRIWRKQGSTHSGRVAVPVRRRRADGQRCGRHSRRWVSTVARTGRPGRCRLPGWRPLWR